MSIQQYSFGHLLKEWRQKRRLSQLELSFQASVSARHLSFIENDRSTPSREMIMRLADKLDVPARDVNGLLLSAGYSPAYPVRPLNDPALASIQKSIEFLLNSQKPFPAFAFDKHWNIVASNYALPQLYEGVSDHLLVSPVNLLRLSLHPEGLRSKIVNLVDWKRHLFHKLELQIERSSDQVLIGLREELLSYEEEPVQQTDLEAMQDQIVIPLVIRSPNGDLCFISTTTVFGTPVDITLHELALELFFPANEETAERVRALK